MTLTRPFVLILLIILTSSGYIPDGDRVKSSASTNNESLDNYCSLFFNDLRSDYQKPDFDVFKKALTGFFNLKAGNNLMKNYLTIIDFSLSSKLDRMWIIDMDKMEVVHHCLVAHGRNSGEEFASHFSNAPSSCKSSLGFYLTGETYIGKHGLSLYLDGVEPGINDKARERTIVMHAADYVSRDFIRDFGRLGRSFGCPSIPSEDHERIINMLSGRSCLYIYYPDNEYQACSKMFNAESAIEGMQHFLSESEVRFDFLPVINSFLSFY